jgi:hypothetical protein
MAHLKTDPMDYGFTDFNGNQWHKAEVDGYNAYNRDIERTNQPTRINDLVEARHKYFVMVVQKYSNP